MKKKILSISIGPWNDIQGGNNVLTNWFKGYGAEFAQVYIMSGYPCNKLCENYFQITDEMMLKSLWGKKAGRSFHISIHEQEKIQEKNDITRSETKVFSNARKMPRSIANLIRDFVWMFGRIDTQKLASFVHSYNPDVVFCTHLFGINFWRIERLIRKYTNAPMIAFTGDSEVSLDKVSFSPLFWVRQISLNLLFRHHIKMFSHYFTFSEELSKRYETISGIPSSTLYKCADTFDDFQKKDIGDPVRIVYAGNIIYNRWETLSLVADALEKINSERERIVLDVYTNTPLTPKMEKRLRNKKGTYIHGRVAPADLIKIYENADIALHIESFTKKYRLDTKDSFSTKIVDLMNSTCAIMAICWKEHNGLKYLKTNDAAICIDDLSLIPIELQNLLLHKERIQEYSRKAWECGKKNHSRQEIQKYITKIFFNN